MVWRKSSFHTLEPLITSRKCPNRTLMTQHANTVNIYIQLNSDTNQLRLLQSIDVLQDVMDKIQNIFIQKTIRE